MTLRQAAMLCYGGALVTLPWAGVGVIHLLTGRDLGGGLQPSWLLLALALLIGGLDLWRRRRGGEVAPVPRLPRAWVWTIAAIAGSVAVSVAGIWIAPASEPLAQTLPRFAKQAIQLGIMGFFVLVPGWWTCGEARWRWTARCLVAGALFQVAYGLLQEIEYFHPLGLLSRLEVVFTSNPSILSGSAELYLNDRFLAVPRLRGTMSEPLYLGSFLLAVIPCVTLTGWRPWRCRAVQTLLLVLLLLTWSRGAWLGAGAAAVATLGLILAERRAGIGGSVFSSRIWRWIGLGAAVLLIVGLVSSAAGWDGFWLPWRRLVQSFSSRDWSNLTRFYSMQAAWRAFQLSPLVGIGWGQFAWHYPALADPAGLQAMFTWPVVNNYPLQILCETGLLGGLVFAGVVVRSLTVLVPRCGAVGRRGPRLATTAALIGVAVQMLTFSQYNLPHIWVCWGLFIAATAREDSGYRGNLRTGDE